MRTVGYLPQLTEKVNNIYGQLVGKASIWIDGYKTNTLWEDSGEISIYDSVIVLKRL